MKTISLEINLHSRNAELFRFAEQHIKIQDGINLVLNGLNAIDCWFLKVFNRGIFIQPTEPTDNS